MREADAIETGNYISIEQQRQAREREPQNEAAKQARRDQNRKVALSLVNSWTSDELRVRMDQTLERSLAGENDSVLDPNAPKYRTEVPIAEGARPYWVVEAEAAERRREIARRNDPARLVNNSVTNSERKV